MLSKFLYSCLCIFDIKIIYIALFLFLYDIVQIPINNSGGHIAHIGGAVWGYYYCIRYNKGQDLVKSFFKNFKNNKTSNDTITEAMSLVKNTLKKLVF